MEHSRHLGKIVQFNAWFWGISTLLLLGFGLHNVPAMKQD